MRITAGSVSSATKNCKHAAAARDLLVYLVTHNVTFSEGADMDLMDISKKRKMAREEAATVDF